MKKLTILLLLFPLSLFAQTPSTTVKVKKATTAKMENQHELYLQAENPLSISIDGIDSILVEVSNGSITGSKGKYTLIATKGSSTILSVYQLVNKKKVLVETRKYLLIKPPNGFAYVGGKTGKIEMTREELCAAKGIMAKLEDHTPVPILSFAVTVGLTMYMAAVKEGDSLFSPEQLASISQAKELGTIYIEYIKAQLPNGAIIKLPGITVILKKKD